jgi:transitional endoplasmic reticulum ATPase
VTSEQITVTVRLSPSALDHRRGVVRLHPEVLDALGLRAWDAVRLTGARISAALAAPGDPQGTPAIALVDDLTLSNLGVTEGADVVLAPVKVSPAKMITVAGSRLASTSVNPNILRLALVGKVLTVGDAVSLLPQDLAPAPGSDAITTRGKLSSSIGATWTSELLAVTSVQPAGPVAVGPSTVVSWRDGNPSGNTEKTVNTSPENTSTPTSESTLSSGASFTDTGFTDSEFIGDDFIEAEIVEAENAEATIPLPDLIGAENAVRRLSEWLDLTFRRPELLEELGAPKQIGVLISGPEGVGKTTLARSVVAAEKIRLISLRAPNIAVLEPAAALNKIGEAIKQADKGDAAVLLLTDIDVLLPATQPPPMATVVLDQLEAAMRAGLSVIATTAHPESVDPRLRTTDLLDRELALSLPDNKTRAELLTVLLRDMPTAPGIDASAIAERTPGFVVADLVALRRDAALHAALRQRNAERAPSRESSTKEISELGKALISQQDLLEATETVRPISMSTSDVLTVGGLTLDDVGGMSDIKQSLTEAVLWPLRYPDSFSRLGVVPPRGVLLYGPPGGGKTFLVRALAGTGAVNVFAVKGAELMDKWVGESERAVRELFRRATDAAPSLVFLDEIDALAPRRGQSSDSGVSDRVVAALLTELDGVEALREVVVLGATNRPELVDPALLRPGRLERLIYVAPPDASARADILRANSHNTPLADDVDLDALASTLDGYSAADCAALIREAALTAMRESLTATEVTAAHLAKARAAIRPSLDPAQLAALEAYSQR